jgi:asparagine synthase (glutamine-hydrolysing)
MCGIAGIVHFDSYASVDAARLRRMGDVLTHRGPDGEGQFIDGPVGLAHRRLAIIDVAAGQQPMSNEDGTVTLVFNGEIYNHADLRPGLEARGHRYATRSDSETILHAYEDDGERVAERLRGMFAFAIWDANRRTLLLGRDRLGIKPLYFAITENELLFGSEIKSILSAMPARPRLNEQHLPSYLASGFVNGEDTLFTGIKRLLPGHTMTWSAGGGFRRRCYWQIPAPTTRSSLPFEAEAASLRDRLTGAVQRHLMSDVPLGVFLSGGLDSSALAAIAARHTTERLKTFAVGFSEREANELGYAAHAASWIGSEHRDLVVTPGEFFAALPRLVWHEDEPIAFPSSVPLYFLSRMAGEHVKVVLTGEGADELFLGYNRYRVTHWNERLGRAYSAITPGAVRRSVQAMVKRLPAASARVLTRTFLALEPGLRNTYLENFAVLSEARQRQLLSRPELLDADLHSRSLDQLKSGEGTLLDRMSHLDLQTYLRELLMKQDQMSMAASIESRVPFLDDDIVEHVAALPASLKLRGWQTKALLRAAVRDIVPPAILTRRKMGFPVPVGRWLSTDFKPLVDEFILGPRARERRLFNPAALQGLVAEHMSGAAKHGDRLWLLMNLEIWQRIFHDGESPEHVMGASMRQAKAA